RETADDLPPSPTQRRPPLALMLVVPLLSAGCDAMRVRTPYFALDRPTAISETRYEIEEEKRKTPFSDTKQDTNRLTQDLKIATRGWAYHPALAVFSLELRPKIKLQDQETKGGPDKDDDLLFLGYTFDSTFLQKKPYSLKLYSSRTRSEFDTSLAPDTTTKTALDRATVLLKNQTLPTNITAERRQTDTEGFRDFTDTSYSGSIDTRHETDRSRTFLRSEYIFQDRDFENTQATVERLLVNARNTYQLTEDARLSSTIFGQMNSTEDTTIDFKTKSVSAAENLFLQHSPNFSSDHEARLDWRDEDDFYSRTIRGTSSLNHQLYENLNTRLRFDVTDENFSGGKRNTYEGDLDFRYRRRIPWGAVILRNGYRVRLEDDESKAPFRNVSDEPHVLVGTTPSFLDNVDVDVDSIVVTGLGGVPLYVEDVDYEVQSFGDSVAIARISTGSIPSGATVLVTYRFTSQEPFKLYKTQIRAGGDLRLWEMLRLFYDFNRLKDHFISGTRPDPLTDDTIQNAGAEFKWRWSTTRLEYEDRDTTRTPLTKWMAREILLFRPGRNLSLSFSGSYTQTDLSDTNDQTRQQMADATVQWRPFRWGEFRLNAFGRRTRGDIQKTDELGLVSRFQARYGRWIGAIRYEILHQEDFDNDQKRDRQILIFEVTRGF
ncbi:MAG: hypothetical protein OEU25_00805, partial [Rhodospirillales bacterium]|nr:hypothetical protein [Rhodospirillales bacterium]